MKTCKTTIALVLVGSIVLGAAGCGSNPLLDAASAGLKIANNQMSQLTSNEVLALSQLVISVVTEETGATIPALTTEQAAAIVAFLQANNINSPDDLALLIENAENDPSSIQGLDALAAAFAGSENAFDPNNPDPQTIGAIFAQAFGQSAPGGG